jgi:hypothetical protein
MRCHQSWASSSVDGKGVASVSSSCWYRVLQQWSQQPQSVGASMFAAASGSCGSTELHWKESKHTR